MQTVAEKRDTIPAPPPFAACAHELLDEVLEHQGDDAELAELEGAFVALLGAHRQLARRAGGR